MSDMLWWVLFIGFANWLIIAILILRIGVTKIIRNRPDTYRDWLDNGWLVMGTALLLAWLMSVIKIYSSL